MKQKTSIRTITQFITITAFCAGIVAVSAAEPPKVGDRAPDFTLNTLEGKPVSLKELTPKKPVVLLMLRGWPGYQCPLCTTQVHDFVSHAAGFDKAQVVMVYPGPADKLKEHAAEFLKDKQWPKNFIFLTDPDYTFTTTYGLRWEAANETAYPSTFIIDTTGTVRFVKISHEHGGRTAAVDVQKQVESIK